MKNLYMEYFCVPKYKKVRDKVMMTRVVVTALIMLACLFAMCFTAYAYFTHNVISGSNVIKAADFEANVTVKDSVASEIALTKEGKIQSAILPAGEYTVTIKRENREGVSETGFCVVTIGDKTYYTQQVGKDASKGVDDATLVFKINLTEETKVTFLSHWGTSSYYGYADPEKGAYYIGDNAVLLIQEDEPPVKSPIKQPAPDENGGEQGSDEGTSTPADPERVETTYTIVAGDNLSKIAKAHGTTVAKLMAYNNLTSDVIYGGDVLKIPPADYVVPENFKPDNSNNESSEPDDGGDVPIFIETTYTVAAGDTLSKIATAFDTTVEKLVAYNGLTSDVIYAGDMLKIPPADYVVPEDTNGSEDPAPEVSTEESEASESSDEPIESEVNAE